jgi:hypothetical protein
VSPDDRTAARLLRVTADDPEYLRQAAAEAAFWEQVHPLGLEAGEDLCPVEQYVNERFTGNPSTDWVSTIPRWGMFTNGLLPGASSPKRLIGDMLTDAGILQPGVAFAVYRKRRA